MAIPVFVAATKNLGNSSVQVQVPVGTVAGYGMLAFIFSNSTAGNATTIPPGWTLLGYSQLSSNFWFLLCTRIAGANEPPAYIFDGHVATSNMVAIMSTYSGIDPNNFVSGFGFLDNANISVNAFIPTITTGLSDTRFVIVGAMNSTATATVPHYATERAFLQSPGSITGGALALSQNDYEYVGGPGGFAGGPIEFNVAGQSIGLILEIVAPGGVTVPAIPQVDTIVSLRRAYRPLAPNFEYPPFITDLPPDVISPPSTQQQQFGMRARSTVQSQKQDDLPPQVGPIALIPLPDSGGSLEYLVTANRVYLNRSLHVDATSLVLDYTQAESTLGDWAPSPQFLPQPPVKRSRVAATDAPPLQPPDAIVTMLFQDGIRPRTTSTLRPSEPLSFVATAFFDPTLTPALLENGATLRRPPTRPLTSPYDFILTAGPDTAALLAWDSLDVQQQRPRPRIWVDRFPGTLFLITDASRFDWQSEYPGPQRPIARRRIDPEQAESVQQWTLTPDVLLPAFVQDSTQRPAPPRGWRVGEPQAQDPPETGDFILWGWHIQPPSRQQVAVRWAPETAFLEVMQVTTTSIIVTGPFVCTAGQIWSPGAEQGDIQESFGIIASVLVVPAPPPIVTSFTPTTGPVGITVTITGSNFTGTSVSFGGVNAPIFSVNSPTQITATVPVGAVTGAVSVTTGAGTGTSAATFTVVVTNISSFTPGTGSPGDSITIAGAGFTAATAVTFNGVLASFSVNSDRQITATVPVGSGSGPIEVVTPGGTATSSNLFSTVPKITSFTPTLAGASSQVVITGVGFTGATAVTFNGTNASSFTVNSDTQITAMLSAAIFGLVTVVVTIATGSATASNAADAMTDANGNTVTDANGNRVYRSR